MHYDRIALTQELASALWRSGSRAYGRALDHWLAAEQMVVQSLRLTCATNAGDDAAGGHVGAAQPPCSLPTSAFPADHVRALAYCFWAHAGQSWEAGVGFWLAAERHIRAICDAVLAGALENGQVFSAPTYWARIRDRAECLWRADGCPAGRDLETWLRAEEEILADLAGLANGKTDTAANCGWTGSKGGDAANMTCYVPTQPATHEARPYQGS